MDHERNRNGGCRQHGPAPRRSSPAGARPDRSRARRARSHSRGSIRCAAPARVS